MGEGVSSRRTFLKRRARCCVAGFRLLWGASWSRLTLRVFLKQLRPYGRLGGARGHQGSQGRQGHYPRFDRAVEDGRGRRSLPRAGGRADGRRDQEHRHQPGGRAGGGQLRHRRPGPRLQHAQAGRGQVQVLRPPQAGQADAEDGASRHRARPGRRRADRPGRLLGRSSSPPVLFSPAMRSLRHWTPRYVVNRLRVLAYKRLHPGEPWLTRDMVELLKTRLTGAHRGLEWGAGRSTLWLAARLGSLVSVEHDEAYCRQVQAALEKKGLRNVDLRFHPAEPDYVAVADKLPPARLDFVLVDGQARDLCALAALPRLKPGGLLVVDNSNLYLPCSSHAPP